VSKAERCLRCERLKNKTILIFSLSSTGTKQAEKAAYEKGYQAGQAL
jgi:hypothetical protein